MFSPIRSNELTFLQESYSKVSMLLASQKYEQAQTIMNELIIRVEMLKPISGNAFEQEKYNQSLSECYVNFATCLFNKQECEESFHRIRSLLEQAISLDNLNYWAYFNLASYLYRTYAYKDALNNMNCSLSCLYLLKAVLSKDLQNRNKEIDLGRSIGYCENNLKARYVRLLMQIKQNRWKMALNQIDLILQISKQCSQLLELKELLFSVAINNTNVQIAEIKNLLKQSILLITQIPPHRERLEGLLKSDLEKNSILKEIDDKIYEFNEVFRQVNELGSSHNIFAYKVLHRANKFDKKIHIISNTIKQSIKEQANLTESSPFRVNSVELEAKVIQRMNESKKSLTSSKNGYGESLFQISKSQNLENSKNLIIGNLLSSINNTLKPIKVLPSEIEEEDDQILHGGNMRKKVDIEVIESQIRPATEYDQPLLSSCEVKVISHNNANEEDDLLLDSLYDKDYEKSKKIERYYTDPKQFSQIKQEKIEDLSASHIYPLSQSHKVFELFLLKAQFREDLKEKFAGIYAHLEYNSGFIQTYKFRSRQVNQVVHAQSQNQNQVEWNESLGFIKIAEEAKNMLVKVYKSQPYYYNDKFLGEGEIEVTTQGVIKIPLYLNMRNVGTVSIKLIISEENLNSSFKKSATSNFSSSMKSESQSSQRS